MLTLQCIRISMYPFPTTTQERDRTSLSDYWFSITDTFIVFMFETDTNCNFYSHHHRSNFKGSGLSQSSFFITVFAPFHFQWMYKYHHTMNTVNRNLFCRTNFLLNTNESKKSPVSLFAC